MQDLVMDFYLDFYVNIYIYYRFMVHTYTTIVVSTESKSNINRTFSFPLDYFTGSVFYYIRLLLAATSRESSNSITPSLSFSVRILSISHRILSSLYTFLLPVIFFFLKKTLSFDVYVCIYKNYYNFLLTKYKCKKYK